jgi:hypothetical protein
MLSVDDADERFVFLGRLERGRTSAVASESRRNKKKRK